jgi:hypothetical protein
MLSLLQRAPRQSMGASSATNGATPFLPDGHRALRAVRRFRGGPRPDRPADSSSPPVPRSPTACSSSTNDIYAEHPMNMPVTTTPDGHTARWNYSPHDPTVHPPT